MTTTDLRIYRTTWVHISINNNNNNNIVLVLDLQMQNLYTTGSIAMCVFVLICIGRDLATGHILCPISVNSIRK
jgi:hypothetical protein